MPNGLRHIMVARNTRVPVQRQQPEYRTHPSLTSFGHPDATVDNGESLICLVWDKANEEFRLRIEFALIRQALEPDLVQGLTAEPKRNHERIIRLRVISNENQKCKDEDGLPRVEEQEERRTSDELLMSSRRKISLLE